MSKDKIKYPVDFTTQCSQCGEFIKVGTRGPDGLVEHKGKSKCLATIKRKEKEAKAKKHRTLFQLGVTLHQGTSSNQVASLVSAPPPILAQIPSTSQPDTPLPVITPVIDLSSIPDEPPDEVQVLDEDHSGASSQICTGLHLPFPEDMNPYVSYPFGLHQMYKLPWDIHIVGQQMTIRSTRCKAPTEKTICKPCTELDSHPILDGIRSRILHGVHENTPLLFQPIAGQIELNRQKTKEIDTQRFRRLAESRKLIGRTTTLEDYKKFVMAVGEGSVNRIDALIRAGLKNKAGIKGLLRLLDKAIRGVYKPKNFTEEEMLRGVIFLKLGGARVAEIAHRSLGSPGVSTLRRRTGTRPLQVSSATPSIKEIHQNIEVSFDQSRNETNGKDTGYVLMLDELKVEQRPRWDDRTNKLVGVCREHSKNLGLDFCTIHEVEALWDAASRQEVHLATEATVAAIGLLSSDNTRIYGSRPILISGTCKREAANQHAQLISTVVNACRAKSQLIRGRLLCIASDGETRRGAALIQLTQKAPLHPSSQIYPLLNNLRLLNLLVGDDDVTSDKDYKHVFKRLRNLLLREKGTLINGVHITPALVSWHLRSAGMPKYRADMLLNPNDKQDVVLVYTLLKEIWSLRDSHDGDKPAFATARRALKILGSLFRHLMLPYTQVTLSLHEQLCHLSAAAHLTLWLFTLKPGGNHFLPRTLYNDIMIMIKNVYFCVAKTKVDHPDASFWIILLGTDRLEVSFGILRTMIGNDANADLLQLGNRLSNVTECAQILARYPHWDRGPRRLNLPAITSEGDVTAKVDHINPASWVGDVRVANILPITAWNNGRREVEEEFSLWGIREALATLEAMDDVDILFPFGTEREPSECDRDEENDDENEIGDAITENSVPQDLPEVDLEDEVTAELTQECGVPFQPFVEVDGRRVYKARVLREFFKYQSKHGSTDRLKRIAGLSRFAVSSGPDVDIVDFDSAFGGPALLVNDPAATLLQCNGHIFLAVVQVIQISLDSRSLPQISLDVLMERTATIRFQILRLRERQLSEHNPLVNEDWEWSRHLETSHKTCGRFVQVINPMVSTCVPGEPTYLFRSDELRAIAATLFDRIPLNERVLLPSVKQSDHYPYRAAGQAAFVCQSNGASQDSNVQRGDCCPQCSPAIEWDRTQGQRVLEHIGAHILFDPSIDRDLEPCGFCLSPAPTCIFYLRKGKGANSSPQVNLATSRCVNLVRFAYQNAATSSTNAPCSNVPVYCPLCPSSASAVWKYNMRPHLKRHHPMAPLDKYQNLYNLSDSERSAMEMIWKKRRMPVNRKRTTKLCGTSLAISDAHSSRLALRNLTDDNGNEDLGLNAGDDNAIGNNDLEDTSSEGEDRSTREDDGEDYPPHSARSITPPPVNSTNCQTGETDSEAIGQTLVATLPSEFTIDAAPTRIGRLRKTRDMDEIHACICGVPVDPQEINDGQAVQCSQRGCETQWFHLECLNFEYAPKNWRCENHARPIKRARRT